MPWQFNPSRDSIPSSQQGAGPSQTHELDYLQRLAAKMILDEGDLKSKGMSKEAVQQFVTEQTLANYKQCANHHWEKEKEQWMLGRHPLFNQANTTASRSSVTGTRGHSRWINDPNKFGKQGKEAQKCVKHTTWGQTSLASVPGVADQIRERAIKRQEFDTYIDLLHQRGAPKDKQAADDYFKYIVMQYKASDADIDAWQKRRFDNYKSTMYNAVAAPGIAQPWQHTHENSRDVYKAEQRQQPFTLTADDADPCTDQRRASGWQGWMGDDRGDSTSSAPEIRRSSSYTGSWRGTTVQKSGKRSSPGKSAEPDVETVKGETLEPVESSSPRLQRQLFRSGCSQQHHQARN